MAAKKSVSTKQNWNKCIAVILVMLIPFVIYVVVTSSFIINPSTGLIQLIKQDQSLIVFIALLFVIPGYIAIMIVLYKIDKDKRRDLTHIIFIILIGLVVSMFFTIREEWIPSPEIVSNTSFSNMSVAVQRISPLNIPIKSVITPINNDIYVTIYNYTPIEPVSVTMSSPPNTIFKYQKLESLSLNKSSPYDQQSNSFVYKTKTDARHTGLIYNSTNEYVINIDYRNTSKLQKQMTTPTSALQKTSKTSISVPTLDQVRITNVTAFSPTNASQTIDKDINTRWFSLGDRQSINYTFDKNYDVSIVGIAFFKGNNRSYSFEINGQEFNSSAKTINLENFTLKTPITNTKTLQIIGHGNTENMYNSLTEVNIYGKPSPLIPIKSPSTPKSEAIIYHNSVPFQWTIRMTDLSLTAYFWIVMTGVVASRFMSLILSKIEGLGKKNTKDFENNIQRIRWQDGLGIMFSFIIALVLFSSFKQANTLTTTILFNISIAFAFGFGFDKTLEVAPRFDPRFSLKKRDDDNDVDIERIPQSPGEEPPQPPGGEEPPQPPGDEEPPQPPER
jgi:hypothetical protein